MEGSPARSRSVGECVDKEGRKTGWRRTFPQSAHAEEEDGQLEDDLEEDEALEPSKEGRGRVGQERVFLGRENDCARVSWGEWGGTAWTQARERGTDRSVGARWARCARQRRAPGCLLGPSRSAGSLWSTDEVTRTDEQGGGDMNREEPAAKSETRSER